MVQEKFILVDDGRSIEVELFPDGSTFIPEGLWCMDLSCGGVAGKRRPELFGYPGKDPNVELKETMAYKDHGTTKQ